MQEELEPELAELLTRLVELDAGNYQTYHPYFEGGGGDEALLNGLADEHRVPEGPTKELASRGYIDMDLHLGKRLGDFRLTPLGRKYVALRSADEPENTVDLSWSAVEPTLREVHAVWLNHGAPQLGLPGQNVSAQLPQLSDEQLATVLHELEREGWIEYRQSLGPFLPQGIRPSSRAVAYFEGWPTQDAQTLGEHFVARLEEAIEQEPDEEQRSRLRKALGSGGSALRDIAVDVAGTMLAKSATGG
jgi:hypothetical protein